MDKFVVGTGRCGSTLLTNMLAKHPDLLVVSEFFATIDRDIMFSPESVSGQRFSELLDTEPFIPPIVKARGVAIKENLGEILGASRSPPLMISTLPMNCDRPEELQEEVLRTVSEFPVQPYVEHYRALFAYLMGRFGKTEWLERSGPSTEYLPELIDAFPTGRFVHLHRDGPETALSMQCHPHFQLWISFYHDPPSREDLLQTEYGGLQPTPNDPLSRRLSPSYLPVERYGEWWNYSVTMAYRGLAKLDPAQVCDVRFEDLVANPASVLDRIVKFFELPERDGWKEEAAALVTGSPKLRLPTLSSADCDALRRACYPAEVLLGRRPPRTISPAVNLLHELGAKQRASAR